MGLAKKVIDGNELSIVYKQEMLGNKNVYKIYYSGTSDSKSVAIMKEELATLLKDAPRVLTEVSFWYSCCDEDYGKFSEKERWVEVEDWLTRHGFSIEIKESE
jgi:hypothetical protein